MVSIHTIICSKYTDLFSKQRNTICACSNVTLQYAINKEILPRRSQDLMFKNSVSEV